MKKWFRRYGRSLVFCHLLLKTSILFAFSILPLETFLWYISHFQGGYTISTDLVKFMTVQMLKADKSALSMLAIMLGIFLCWTTKWNLNMFYPSFWKFKLKLALQPSTLTAFKNLLQEKKEEDPFLVISSTTLQNNTQDRTSHQNKLTWASLPSSHLFLYLKSKTMG